MRFAAIVLAVLLCAGTAVADLSTRDGKRWDQGATMTKRSDNAPAELDKLMWMLGTWKVEMSWTPDDTTSVSSNGYAEITFLNRGYGFMERFQGSDFDGQGNDLATLSFVTFNPGAKRWAWGIADSHREDIVVFDGNSGVGGDEVDASIELSNTIRGGGGTTRSEQVLRLRRVAPGQLEMHLEVRSPLPDGNHSVRTQWRRTYSKVSGRGQMLPAGSGVGSAAPDLPAEAREFDFFIGEFDETHWRVQPTGQELNWKQNGTAVRALNGHAVMEHAWFDTDPSLPDAATSIIRIYNQSTRTWECLYFSNRFPSLLYFGGVREGDRMIMHGFDRNTASGPLNYWIFHSIEEEGYAWHFDQSADRGKTWSKVWTIDAKRK